MASNGPNTGAGGDSAGSRFTEASAEVTDLERLEERLEELGNDALSAAVLGDLQARLYRSGLQADADALRLLAHAVSVVDAAPRDPSRSGREAEEREKEENGGSQPNPTLH
eukprot:Rhum_TRINITY_DN11536_c0_g2::Rhum_TRINITY_DN11536_c0_g2_i1::g.45302::m.45302